MNELNITYSTAKYDGPLNISRTMTVAKVEWIPNDNSLLKNTFEWKKWDEEKPVFKKQFLAKWAEDKLPVTAYWKYNTIIRSDKIIKRVHIPKVGDFLNTPDYWCYLDELIKV